MGVARSGHLGPRGLARTSLAGQTRVPLLVGGSAGVIAVAALAAFASSRLTGDSAMGFVATGTAGVALNLVMFDLIWQEGRGGLRGISTLQVAELSAPAFAGLAAWLLFAVCLIFAVPWWDRRGHNL